MDFNNKTVLITGASRGIGKAIALKLAAAGANIVIAAKSTEEDVRLGGTIFSAAAEIEAAGGKALAVYCDIRDEKLIGEVMEKTAARFGILDILINNASAISITNTEKTEIPSFYPVTAYLKGEVYEVKNGGLNRFNIITDHNRTDSG